MPVCAEKTPLTCQDMNIWMNARLEAGFKSRAEAASMIPLGERTLARIESGEKIPTPNEALILAENYRAPGLVLKYCSDNCDIGKKYRCKVEGKDFPTAVIALIKEQKEMKEAEDKLIDICSDGKVNDDEETDFLHTMDELDGLIQAATELKYWYLSKYLKQKPVQHITERVDTKTASAAATR